MMEDGLYDQLELVFDRIDDYEKRDEDVPIMELYFCYTVSSLQSCVFFKWAAESGRSAPANWV